MNETTLDLAPVRTIVDDLLGPAGGFTVWFQKLLQLSMATSAVGRFVDFGTLARNAFDATAAAGSIEIPVGSWEDVAAAIGSIPPHPEVPAALGRLREAGWTTVALTNSGQATVEAQCERAGLADRFDHIISVEAVQIYKPSAAPYEHAAAIVGVPTGEVWMVACHDWDLAGARSAGMRTAYVARPGMSYADVYDPPDILVADFAALADALIARG